MHSEAALTAAIEEVCKSKAEEFRMLGYEQVTGVDIWMCVSQKYKQIPPLHRVINDVLTLKTNVFMNWLMIRAYTESGPDDDQLPSSKPKRG
nr:post-transcriptional regulator [Tumebacillus flagellatus]